MFWIRVNRKLSWVYTFGGFAFGAIVFNPNYTLRQSVYARKFMPVFFATIGMAWGYKKEH